MSNTALVAMERCVSGCGALVRDGGYCTRCEDLAVTLERKRLAEIERNRRYGVVCEASDFPTVLGATTPRERMQIAAILLGVSGLGAGLLFLGLMGVKAVTGWILSRGL